MQTLLAQALLFTLPETCAGDGAPWRESFEALRANRWMLSSGADDLCALLDARVQSGRNGTGRTARGGSGTCTPFWRVIWFSKPGWMHGWPGSGSIGCPHACTQSAWRGVLTCDVRGIGRTASELRTRKLTQASRGFPKGCTRAAAHMLRVSLGLRGRCSNAGADTANGMRLVLCGSECKHQSPEGV